MCLGPNGFFQEDGVSNHHHAFLFLSKHLQTSTTISFLSKIQQEKERPLPLLRFTCTGQTIVGNFIGNNVQALRATHVKKMVGWQTIFPFGKAYVHV